MKRGVITVITAAAALLAAAACSSSSSSGSSTPHPTVTVTRTVNSTPSTAPSPSPTTGATDLVLTPQIREQLIDAKAREVHVKSSAFTSLYKGTAYYAIDNMTGTYWAGASVVPSRHNLRAQVSSQDEGGYNVFELRPGGAWQTFDVGLDGPDAREGAQCPVKVPADVLKVWHWAPNTCDPPPR